MRQIGAVINVGAAMNHTVTSLGVTQGETYVNTGAPMPAQVVNYIPGVPTGQGIATGGIGMSGVGMGGYGMTGPALATTVVPTVATSTVVGGYGTQYGGYGAQYGGVGVSGYGVGGGVSQTPGVVTNVDAAGNVTQTPVMVTNTV